MAFTLRVQAIPAGALNVKKVQQEIEKALKEEGKVLQKEFNKTTEKWTGDKPRFDVTTGGVGGSSGSAFVHCYPTGSEEAENKWVGLEDGIPGHPITPRGNYPLRFPFRGRGQSYSPRTRPGYLGSDAGDGKKAGPMTKFWGVNHPGNDPRNWSEALAKQEEEPFAERIQNAVDRGFE